MEYWYGRPESLLAQTFAETQKKVVKQIKNTQQVSPENLIDPQYGCQFCSEWEIPLRTST